MKNNQGFLSNKLNKYAIRKFTVGTASLLIGATLVFGVGSEAKADELDKTSTNDSTSNSDKGKALDVEDIKPVDDSQQITKQEASDINSTIQDATQQSSENIKTNSNEDSNTISQSSEETTQDNSK